VPIAISKRRERFSAALRTLAGSSQREVAELAGIHEVTLSRLLNGHAVLNETRLMTDICRCGLMVKAVLLGWEEEQIMKYTEHAIFGLPRVDPAVAVPEARERAAQVKKARDARRIEEAA
jgi:transcriptional regulator with XRE-family HTH domain